MSVWTEEHQQLLVILARMESRDPVVRMNGNREWIVFERARTKQQIDALYAVARPPRLA